MDQWQFTAAELEELPSYADGLSKEKDSTYRFRLGWFIEDLTRYFYDNCRLSLGNALVVTMTSQIYFHRFFAIQSFRKYDRFIIAAACIFLATKVEEFFRPKVNGLHQLARAYSEVRKKFYPHVETVWKGILS